MIKRLLLKISLAIPVWFMLGSMSFAMCMWFAPPSRNFAQATNMKTLVSISGNKVRLSVQPQFSGNAKDFALVMPFPSQPKVNEAPEHIFTQLEDLTNPINTYDDVVFLQNGQSESLAARSPKGVQVIEKRDVGDFTTTTISANSESALTTWLDNQGYEITDAKKAIIADYIHKGGYFVALKVNMSKATVDKQGFIQGELKPISFDFESNNGVMLPTRLLAGEKSLVTLTVYTLSEDLTYVPGAEVKFSKKVTSNMIADNPALESYDAWRKWLVRNTIQIKPSEITTDLRLLTTTDNVVVVPGEQPFIINPDKLEKGTGVQDSQNGDIYYTVEKTPKLETAQTTSKLSTSVVVALAVSNILLLGVIIYQHNIDRADN